MRVSRTLFVPFQIFSVTPFPSDCCDQFCTVFKIALLSKSVTVIAPGFSKPAVLNPTESTGHSHGQPGDAGKLV
jgi:hypothetical protein